MAIKPSAKPSVLNQSMLRREEEKIIKDVEYGLKELVTGIIIGIVIGFFLAMFLLG